MDTEVLVGSLFEDGRRLLDQVARDGLLVSVALWLKTTEEGLWRLYLAMPSIDDQTLREAYRDVYSALGKISASWISPSDVQLISDSNPIARDASAIRNRSSSLSGSPMRYRGKRLGNLSIIEAYIYPMIAFELGQTATKHGARVYLLDDGVAIVKQTVKRRGGQIDRYVIDGQHEMHVDPGDDAALGAAVRAALEGHL